MLKIGVTGNIGAGKTQVCIIFELLRIPVYYADPRARYLMKNDERLKKAIQKLLGNDAYFENGELNKTFISASIFNDDEKRLALNHLVHPAVAKDFEEWALGQKSPYVIKEAALLFEAGSYKELDYTIVVVADEEVRLKRVLQRDQASESEVRKKMGKQMAQETKEKMADFMIRNNGSEALVKQVLNLHSQFISIV